MTDFKIHTGDVLEVLPTLPDASINCCVTSPPYFGLRDYGHDGQIGLEKTPDEFVAKLVQVFREVKRVLRDDGTLWLNLGDSYGGSTGGNTAMTGGKNDPERGKKMGFGMLPKTESGLPSKNLLGIPWRVAFALQADGWYLRQDIIWHKPNPMPESVRDRCTKAHEYIFLLAKSARYYYDIDAVKERALNGTDLGLLRSKNAGEKDSSMVAWHAQSIKDRHDAGYDSRVGNESGMRNKRSVWSVTTSPYSEAHFATFPPDLIRPCILAGCPENGTVLDPFNGAGTTGVVCMETGRNYTGIELNPEYVKMAERRIREAQPQWFGGVA